MIFFIVQMFRAFALHNWLFSKHGFAVKKFTNLDD